MKIIYFGNNVRGTVCLRALLENKMEIVAVIGHPESTSLWGETVEAVCRQEKIPIYQPDNVNSREFMDIIKNIKFDIGILSGYGKIIHSPLLEIPPHGFINLHGGLLPSYRGSSTSRWVLMNDERIAGISILQVDNGIDTGPILAQNKFDINDNFDIKDIISKQLKLFPSMLLNVLEKISKSSLSPVYQNITEGTYWHSLSSDDAKIKWSHMTSRQVYNMIRAFTDPYAGAYSYNNGKKIRLIRSKEIPETFKGVPGRICAIRDNGVVVVTKDRGILIEKVRTKDKEITNAKTILKIGNFLN